MTNCENELVVVCRESTFWRGCNTRANGMSHQDFSVVSGRGGAFPSAVRVQIVATRRDHRVNRDGYFARFGALICVIGGSGASSP